MATVGGDFGYRPPGLGMTGRDPLSGPRGRAVAAVLQVMQEGLPLRGADWLEGLETRDKGLAVQIAMGSLRHYSLLSAQLTRCMTRPLSARRYFIWAVLVTALFQARFLRVPARAAVHEAVTLVKKSRERAMAPFCNAVLRKAVLLDADVVLHDITDPIERLALETAYPMWLVRRWWHQVGESVCRQRLEAGNQPAPLTLRLHGDPVAQQATWQTLSPLGARLCPDTPGAVVFAAAGGVEGIPGYAAGRFAVADQGAQWIPRLLQPGPGQRILDACAAPGGKTAHLVQLAGEGVTLTAVDKSPARVRRMRENLKRLRVEGVEIVLGDVADDRLLVGRTFHRALIDAPCSGTGIIRRHPDIKWLRREGDPARLQREQLAILEAVARKMERAGVMVYATCSMEPEENREVVRMFLSKHPQWSLDRIVPETLGLPSGWIDVEGMFQTWPGLCDMDGFFAARLVQHG
ncbi:MAG: 16S rRNA (cytosine(967)-C(5))-methyltransferase RsmB [Magnetococcales bacterium]|nr:16S rRNA (cytosine(967)-C(5))-methyltransferase RsmB [Magnetococcales bacterium]